ncbi:Shedu anti-phage system protein SduA domain-containing protein [Vibrio parahaemolyticus]|uniref:Shedu anti-phage system protein SduA domain-containing protein n=2 Tax=Vibrio parahaemolyticus TaxID=670 RepID=UPI001B828D90|nr:Shedu anti-phage system protein SduA domain-containing protein [Vibrio parahaemolyticus]EJC1078528.1 DUF4263 domain-containing protein [Vibrio parahaemolyticus]EJK2183486.1 DUF4263 domain-containing protein [Vibrio parahaemolyticus]EJT3522283.1 DUF4263 domain-containing protein [Vibrio parahaemolyticus]ELA7772618.1 DUF4263 domain-containing protein [Vibrio parahaemolyticus]MDF4985823.1 DUF4263 domain-containing protein [Vibrio parahaemolyticus]
MKISDIIFEYKIGNQSKDKNICRIRVFVNTGKLFCLVTDLGDMSIESCVTHTIENIKEELVERGYIPNNTIIIEHNPSSTVSSDTFEIVNFDKDNNPDWKRISVDSLINLLETTKEELLDKTLENRRLFDEIERIRTESDPFINSPFSEPVEVINRRNSIQSKAIEKSQIQKLIDAGSIEQEIQRLLKTDLSVFGDFYSQPNEEYIVFSEFPILDGSVDFVVFSGRSRMDVTLIEVKGADFNIINSTGYKSFSAKTNEAIDQVRNRLGLIYRDYNDFRKIFLDIKNKVESGEQIHNSLVGPKGKLQVDDNKDINIHTVVIAGRGKADYDESRKRQDLEYNTKPPIRLESWDSFINKMPRN